jgi:hypothetical protein
VYAVVPLVPAAGQITRISLLPLCKELVPACFQVNDGEKISWPKLVTHYLLEKFRNVEFGTAFIVLRKSTRGYPDFR